MLWPSLRARRSNNNLRRNSTLEPIPTLRQSEQLPRNNASVELLSPHLRSSTPAQSRNSESSRPPSSQAGRPLASDDLPPVHDGTSKQRRFSMLKFRNASDPHLFARAKQQAAAAEAPAVPPMPHLGSTPAIITTAPTMEVLGRPQKKKPKLKLSNLQKQTDINPTEPSPRISTSRRNEVQEQEPSRRGSASALTGSRVTFDEPERSSGTQTPGAPPAYGDEAGSSLALPIARLSESSRSDGSSGDHVAYAQTTTTHTVSTTTTFFRLPRRKKKQGPLFPLPVKIPPPASSVASSPTPRLSTSGPNPSSPTRSTRVGTPVTALRRPFFEGRTDSTQPSPLPSPSHLARTSMSFSAMGAPMLRHDSTTSARSGLSTPSLAPPMRLGHRGRSSTMGSLNGVIGDEPLPTPPLPPSGRTSTSTTGRSSLGGIFSLGHRLRHNSEPAFPRNGSGAAIPGTPGSGTSKANSFSISREPINVPERKEDDTPAKYLIRLEEAVSRGVVASVLSKSSDTFSHAALRSYMRGFPFYGDPMDMAIRKLLMEVELPKETQQIDRVLQGFADRYDECNPGIFASPDQAYFIAFSILILHTDVFNKNNKHKMQKHDYVKNTQGEGIADDILECFYDNISYTPFIHVEDDLDINGERIVAQKGRKKLLKVSHVEPMRKNSKEPVDPYTLILDNRLESLRPTLKDVMNLDDPYNYLGTAKTLDLPNLHKTFFKSGVLQIVSARSRPEAFMHSTTVTNPDDTRSGVVDIKVTKVGVLWRKEVKRKKTRSPWQEWGAILTGSQLYFFRNVSWVKSLVQQHDAHHKQGHAGHPVIYKPPLEVFKPDALMPTDDAVALMDASYKKHKNGFIFVRHGGFEETFLADTEVEMNDWLAKLNYAAAFRSAGVRMRGVVGGNYDGQRSRGMRRMDTSSSARTVQGPTGEVSIQSGKIDPQLAQQILVARRQIMTLRISEGEEKLQAAQKELESQLRNARHLQILAPIQVKTREQLILAAGRMSAKLKWVRMEMWRMKCHTTILKMDLDDEIKTSTDAQIRNERLSYQAPLASSTPSSAHVALGRLETKAPSIASPQRTLIGTQPSPKDGELGMEDVFRTPQEISRQPSSQKVQGSWELPPISFSPHASARGSVSSVAATSPKHQSLTHFPSVASVRASTGQPSLADTASRLATPTPSVDDAEKEVLEQAGIVGPEGVTPDSKRPETASESDKDKVFAMSPDGDAADGRAKIRRSLHRTLREAHVPSHHRSRKGKDSGSSAVLADDTASSAEKEGLARSTGSFTVHGKKASVVTFGSEWHKMSPEERLRLRKSAHSDDAKLLVPTAIEDDADSNVPAFAISPRESSTATMGVAKLDGSPSRNSLASTTATGERKSSYYSVEDSEASIVSRSYLDADSRNEVEMMNRGAVTRGANMDVTNGSNNEPPDEETTLHSRRPRSVAS
ncbi:MAG: hypothetical protein M1812_006622 [Candelaria pacifica]|nr:MAG: hypothetical protein M1812_006622 [Candelaria pacifica]